MIALLLLLGCPKATPPTMYPVPLPPIEGPELVEWEAAPDECPEVAPILPGKGSPWIGADGNATCRGLLLPESEYAFLLHHETLANYWSARALVCHEGRQRDRLHGQAVFNATWQSGLELERENTSLRIGGAATAVGALVLGAGVGIAAVKISTL